MIIPVTILTGFLGSGKTTLLNRILQERGRFRFAIIENEFGEIGIDNQLVENAGENLFEMNNGCLCCTVKTDLMRILDELWVRRDAFDYVLIESTGLADPGAVVQTFVFDRAISERYRLDGIISIVDALHLPWQLKNTSETAGQIRYGDVILLNKTDLVSTDTVAELEKNIRLQNLHARIYPTAYADIPLKQVLNIGAFHLDNIVASDPAFLDLSSPFEWARLYQAEQGVYQLQFENSHNREPRVLLLYAGDGSEQALESTFTFANALFKQAAGSAQTFRLEPLPMPNADNRITPLPVYTLPAGLKQVKTEVYVPEPGHYLFCLQMHPHHFGLWQNGQKIAPLLTREFFDHHHQESVQSVALTFEGTLDGEKVDDWLTDLLRTKGDDLYRIKGILSVSHSDQKIIVQAVHQQINSRYGADWGTGARQNVIVFIGRHLNKTALENGLAACRTI